MVANLQQQRWRGENQVARNGPTKRTRSAMTTLKWKKSLKAIFSVVLMDGMMQNPWNPEENCPEGDRLDIELRKSITTPAREDHRLVFTSLQRVNSYFNCVSISNHARQSLVESDKNRYKACGCAPLRLH